MIRRTLQALLCVTATGLLACQTVASNDDRSAVITNPDEASRAALQLAVNTALRTDVGLSNNALTDTDLLTIERALPHNIEGSPAQGRSMEKPIQFRLVINGSDCILIDQRDATRYPLEHTSCSAVN